MDKFDKDEDETIFSGWYLDKEYTQEFTQAPASNLTLYAKFAKPIIIKFDLGEGSSLLDYLAISYVAQYEKYWNFGKTFEEWLNDMTLYVYPPYGCDFDKWFADKGLTAVFVPSGWPSQDLTLYAGYKSWW